MADITRSTVLCNIGMMDHTHFHIVGENECITVQYVVKLNFLGRNNYCSKLCYVKVFHENIIK